MSGGVGELPISPLLGAGSARPETEAQRSVAARLSRERRRDTCPSMERAAAVFALALG